MAYAYSLPKGAKLKNREISVHYFVKGVVPVVTEKLCIILMLPPVPLE